MIHISCWIWCGLFVFLDDDSVCKRALPWWTRAWKVVAHACRWSCLCLESLVLLLWFGCWLSTSSANMVATCESLSCSLSLSSVLNGCFLFLLSTFMLWFSFPSIDSSSVRQRRIPLRVRNLKKYIICITFVLSTNCKVSLSIYGMAPTFN